MAGFDFNSWGKGQIGGDLLKGLGAFFGGAGGGSNPANAAMDYFNQISPMLHQYLDQYANIGNDVIPGLKNQYAQLMNDPTAVMNKIGGTYQQSPDFQNQLKQALGAAKNMAAAGGMAGSPMAQERGAGIATNMANQDYNQYLDRGLNQFNTGLQGEQGFVNLGAQESNNLAQMLMEALQSQGMTQFAGKEWQNAQNNKKKSMWGDLVGLGGDALGVAGAMGWL